MKGPIICSLIINAQENISDYLKCFSCQHVHLIRVCLNQCPCAPLAENICTTFALE